MLQYTAAQYTCGTMCLYIAETNILHILCEPELESWNVTSHILIGQVSGSELEKIAALSSCIVPNSSSKSVMWKHFGFPGDEAGTVANRNVAI